MAGVFKKTRRLAFLGAAGAVVYYFLDPSNGRGRRARAKEQLTAKLSRTGGQVQQKAEYVGDKVEGTAHRVTHPGGQAPEDDKTLKDKIQSEVLGGSEFEGHEVVVDAVDGVVALRGQVKRAEQVHDLEAAVRKVPGVREVENYLHLPDTPAPNKQDSLGA